MSTFHERCKSLVVQMTDHEKVLFSNKALKEICFCVAPSGLGQIVEECRVHWTKHGWAKVQVRSRNSRGPATDFGKTLPARRLL